MKDIICQNSHKNNLNRFISIFKTESTINKLPKQKVSGLYKFTGKFYQTFKEKTIPILCHWIEAEEILPNSFHEASITLILKAENSITKKERHKPIYVMNIYVKTFQKIRKLNPTMYEKKHSWCLNNTGLNCIGPLTNRFFSISYTRCACLYTLYNLLKIK